MTCASARFEWGLTGVSFFVVFDGARWLVNTWAPRTYVVPDGADVAVVCLAVLGHGGGTPGSVAPEIVARYGLVELDDDDDDDDG